MPQQGYETRCEKAMVYQELEQQQKTMDLNQLPKKVKLRIEQKVQNKVNQVLFEQNNQCSPTKTPISKNNNIESNQNLNEYQLEFNQNLVEIKDNYQELKSLMTPEHQFYQNFLDNWKTLTPQVSTQIQSRQQKLRQNFKSYSSQSQRQKVLKTPKTFKNFNTKDWINLNQQVNDVIQDKKQAIQIQKQSQDNDLQFQGMPEFPLDQLSQYQNNNMEIRAISSQQSIRQKSYLDNGYSQQQQQQQQSFSQISSNNRLGSSQSFKIKPMFSGNLYKQPTLSTQVPQTITNRYYTNTPVQKQRTNYKQSNNQQEVNNNNKNNQNKNLGEQDNEILDVQAEYKKHYQNGINYEDDNNNIKFSKEQNQLQQIKEDSIQFNQKNIQNYNSIKNHLMNSNNENNNSQNELSEIQNNEKTDENNDNKSENSQNQIIELQNQIQDYKMDNTHCIVQMRPIREYVKQAQKNKFQIYYSEIEDKLDTIAQMRENNKDQLPENLAIVERTLYQTLDKTKNINKELQNVYKKEKGQNLVQERKQEFLLTIEQKEQKEKEKIQLQNELKETIEQYGKLQKFTFDKKLADEYNQLQQQELKKKQEEKQLIKLKVNPDKKEEKDKHYNILKVIKDVNLEKKIQQVADKIKTYGEYNKRLNLHKIKRSLINQLMIYKRLDLKISEVIKNRIFYKQPYDRQQSKEMFQLIKQNDVQSVDRLLRNNKYHVYDYDTCFETPLHWACKRGHLLLVKLLLDYKAFVNSKDHIGRTPLYFAIREGHSKIVQLLLQNRAEPWNEGKCNYDQFIKTNCKVSTETKIMYKTAKKIHLLLFLVPQHQQDTLWKRMNYIFEQDQLAYRLGDKKLGK